MADNPVMADKLTSQSAVSFGHSIKPTNQSHVSFSHSIKPTSQLEVSSKHTDVLEDFVQHDLQSISKKKQTPLQCLVRVVKGTSQSDSDR